MKIFTSLLTLLPISTITAAPAIIWKDNNNNNDPTIHSSDVTELPRLLSSTLLDTSTTTSTTPNKPSIVFLINHSSGTESKDGLTTLTSTGKLPQIASNHASNAHSVHHYVRGIDNTQSVTRDVKNLIGKENVLITTLEEYYMKLPVLNHDSTNHDGRAHAILNRQLVIVKLNTNSKSSMLDDAVSKSITSSSIGNVMLTSVRTKAEMELERTLMEKSNAAHASQHRTSQKVISPTNNNNKRRRMEDVDGERDNKDDDTDYTGIYFVHMTPNILTGLLFGAFFIFVSLVGIGQLGSIASQDLC